MRETIADFAITAYTFLLPIAWVMLAVAIVVLLPMAAFRKTRTAAGTGLIISSYVFGLTTWFLGAAVSFGAFGWLGLIIGLLFAGIGVVPLGIIGAIFKLKIVSLGVSILVMAIIVFAARIAGTMLYERGED